MNASLVFSFVALLVARAEASGALPGRAGAAVGHQLAETPTPAGVQRLRLRVAEHAAGLGQIAQDSILARAGLTWGLRDRLQVLACWSQAARGRTTIVVDVATVGIGIPF